MTQQQIYDAALARLREVAAQKDFTPEGDRAFYEAREAVYWAKLALCNSVLKGGAK